MEPFQDAVFVVWAFGLLTYMNSSSGRAQNFLLPYGGIAMMTRKNKLLDRTAELLLRVSVKSWKNIKLTGKGQLSKLSKRGGERQSKFFLYYTDFSPLADHVP